MDPIHHILSCIFVTWVQTVTRLSLTHHPVTFPSRRLANLHPRRLPSWLIPSRLPHSRRLNYCLLSSPARLLRYCLSNSLFLWSICIPSHFFPSRLLSSCLPTSRLLTYCLPKNCHLTSSQPPSRLRWALPSISHVDFPHFINSPWSSFILVHPLHWKLKLSAWTSAQDFFQLLQLLHYY